MVGRFVNLSEFIAFARCQASDDREEASLDALSKLLGRGVSRRGFEELLSDEPASELSGAAESALQALVDIARLTWPAFADRPRSELLSTVRKLYTDPVKVVPHPAGAALNRVMLAYMADEKRSQGGLVEDLNRALHDRELADIVPQDEKAPIIRLATVRRALEPERPLDRRGLPYHALVRALSVLLRMSARELTKLPLWADPTNPYAAVLCIRLAIPSEDRADQASVFEELEAIVQRRYGVLKSHLLARKPPFTTHRPFPLPSPQRHESNASEFVTTLAFPVKTTSLAPTAADCARPIVLLLDLAREVLVAFDTCESTSLRLAKQLAPHRVTIGLHTGTDETRARLAAMAAQAEEVDSGIALTADAYAMARAADVRVVFGIRFLYSDKPEDRASASEYAPLHSLVSEVYFGNSEELSPAFRDEDPDDRPRQVQAAMPTRIFLSVELANAALYAGKWWESIDLSRTILAIDPLNARASSITAIAYANIARTMESRVVPSIFSPLWFDVLAHVRRALTAARRAVQADDLQEDAHVLHALILLEIADLLALDLAEAEPDAAWAAISHELRGWELAPLVPEFGDSPSLALEAFAHRMRGRLLFAARAALEHGVEVSTVKGRAVVWAMIVDQEIASLLGRTRHAWNQYEPHRLLLELGWSRRGVRRITDDIDQMINVYERSILRWNDLPDLRLSYAVLCDFAGHGGDPKNPPLVRARRYIDEAIEIATHQHNKGHLINRTWGLQQDALTFVADAEKALAAIGEKPLYAFYTAWRRDRGAHRKPSGSAS